MCIRFVHEGTFVVYEYNKTVNSYIMRSACQLFLGSILNRNLILASSGILLSSELLFVINIRTFISPLEMNEDNLVNYNNF